MIWEFFILSKRIQSEIKEAFDNDRDNVLDLGCGSNPYYHKCVRGKILCFDKIKTNKADIIGDAGNLPFKPNSFDKVISVNSFYYFKNPFIVVKDLHSALKRGGKLVLVVPFFYPIHDAPADRYRFTEYGLRTLVGEHFTVEKIKTIGGIFNLPAIIMHSMIKGLPLIFPKFLKSFVQVLAYILYPLYILAQLFSIFDVFDKTKRFPTYYFLVARK